MDENVGRFIENVRAIQEVDFGDFMRVANSYLLGLQSQILKYDPHINSKFREMQNHLQFTPNWVVESTRHKLILDASYLDDLLQGHSQDVESAPQTIIGVYSASLDTSPSESPR